MSSVHIPQTEAEQYYAIKDMMASNLCSKGVFAMPTESLAKLTSKILNIETPFDSTMPVSVSYLMGGSLSSLPAAGARANSPVTINPPSNNSINWGGTIGSRTPQANECRLLAATIRTSWYSSSYANYNSVHFIQLYPSTTVTTPTEATWGNSERYSIFNRPFYNNYPDTSNNVQTVTQPAGAVTFSLYPYSNSTTYNYWNPSYCQLTYCCWLIKRPKI
jgi:hypothetical protein